MEFINKFKEKQQTARQKDIQQQAQHHVRLVDFDDKLFIAFHDTPMIPITDDMTPSEILEKLSNLRKSYIDYGIRQLSLSQSV